ncbi:MAG TPA: FAD-binding oxidoreductase [Candidatus Saccharimonadales bacterium]|nr:FAD-binding oxidoreductase [Candidatus Saccharimonadales bacterium]
MSKAAHYLQEHLMGEVMISPDVREFFATDASIFTVTPSTIVYPKNENDVRKVARFTWQLAERGRVVPITARGNGTDQSGAALGSEILMVFPAYMNKVIDFDGKSGQVVVEPGINYGTLQQVLMSHGRFLPPYPASMDYSTVGGAVANNAGGEKSVKYGDTKNFVKRLRVVLANGEVITTGRLNKRELNKKLGLSSFEGEIYRAVDTLIEENNKIIKESVIPVTRNASGYCLPDVRTKDGFDLTPLFVGSQGTLGIITEIQLETEAYTKDTTLLVGMFDDLDKVQTAVNDLRALSDTPSLIEMIDGNLLNLVDEINPNQLKDVILKPYPKVVLFVEFDDGNDRTHKKMVKKAIKILERNTIDYQVADDDAEKNKLWKLRQATSLIISHTDGKLRATPLIEDGIVPPDKLTEFLKSLYKLLEKNKVRTAVWGHAGEANLQTQPYLDLGHVGDRQKLFRILEEYHDLIIELNGSITAGHGDGRIRTPYISRLYGNEIFSLFEKIKKIFDPYNLLNPGIKTNLSVNDIKPTLRDQFSLGAWYDHLPRG